MSKRERRTGERGPAAQAGFTLIETIVAMSLFAIGILGLAQVQFAASRSNTTARLTSSASLLASDRLEQCVHAPAFDGITPDNFPDEEYGDVEDGDARYAGYRRTVDVVDTVDLTGRVSMKTITVRVTWHSLHGDRSVELASRVARF